MRSQALLHCFSILYFFLIHKIQDINFICAFFSLLIAFFSNLRTVLLSLTACKALSAKALDFGTV